MYRARSQLNAMAADAADAQAFAETAFAETVVASRQPIVPLSPPAAAGRQTSAAPSLLGSGGGGGGGGGTGVGYRTRAPTFGSGGGGGGGGIARRPSMASTVASMAAAPDNVHHGLTKRPVRNALMATTMGSPTGGGDDMTGFPTRQETREGAARMFAAKLEERRAEEGGRDSGGTVHDGDDDDDATFANGDVGAGATVEEHINKRVNRGRRGHHVGRCEQCSAWFISHVLLTWAFIVSVILTGLGVLFLFVFTDANFGENPAYNWMFFLAGAVGVMIPLRMAETALFWTLDAIGRRASANSALSEVVDFADAARGHLAHIGLVIMALLLRAIIFGLVFDPDSTFYFNATMASLLVLIAGLVIKKAALKATLRKLYVQKHQKGVRDVIFYAEVARRLTAPPLTTVRRAAASRKQLQLLLRSPVPPASSRVGGPPPQLGVSSVRNRKTGAVGGGGGGGGRRAREDGRGVRRAAD